MSSVIRGSDDFDSATGVINTALAAVGSYAWMFSTTASSSGISSNSTYAGSGLRYNGYTSTDIYNGNLYSYGNTAPSAPAGTWRAMGHAQDSRYNHYNATLFLRIS